MNKSIHRFLLIVFAFILVACQSDSPQAGMEFQIAETPVADGGSPSNPTEQVREIEPEFFEPEKSGRSSPTFINIPRATGAADLLAASAYHGYMMSLMSYQPYGNTGDPALLAISGYLSDPSMSQIGNARRYSAVAPHPEGGYWLAFSNGGDSNVYRWMAIGGVNMSEPAESLNGYVLAGGYSVLNGKPVSVFITSGGGTRAYAYLNGEWVNQEMGSRMPGGADKAWLRVNALTSFLALQVGSEVYVYQGRPDFSGLHEVGKLIVGENRPVSVDLRGGLLAVVFSPDDGKLVYTEFGDEAKTNAYLIQDVSNIGAVKSATVLLTSDTKYALVVWVYEQQKALIDGEVVEIKFPLLVRSIVNRQPDPVRVSPMLRRPDGANDERPIIIPSLIASSDEIRAAINVWTERTRSDTDYLFARFYYPNAGDANSVYGMMIGVDEFVKNLRSGKTEGGGTLLWGDADIYNGYRR